MQLVGLMKSLHRLCDIGNEMYIMNLNVFEVKKRALKAGDEKVFQQISQGRDIVSMLRACFTCAIRVMISYFVFHSQGNGRGG